MCPYCGEDVPDDSKSCWKCGTELSGTGPDGEASELTDDWTALRLERNL